MKLRALISALLAAALACQPASATFRAAAVRTPAAG
ncbi:MAG: hypothetical protein FD126_2526, partial [Elusimicrobia bacterium]